MQARASAPPMRRLARRVVGQIKSKPLNARARILAGTCDWMSGENVMLPVEVPIP